MSWSFRYENEIRPPKGGVLVRRYPFPYRAALTISNDTDRMRIEAFNDIHDYVNGTGHTCYGPGLGLEMSDSFWIWSEGKCLSLFHSSPFDNAPGFSPEAERVIALIKSGVIDALHNFGQWTVEKHMRREDAQRALEILDRYGLHPRIWINHGGKLMRHQIEGRWGVNRVGDDPRDESYCYDLLRKAGFLYFSHAYVAEEHRFGEHRSYRNQDEFEKDLASFDFTRWLRRFDPAENTYFCPYGPLSSTEELDVKRKLFNKILVPETAKDGTPLLLFKRFRGIDRPSAGCFVSQVNYYSLRELVKFGACVVVYQHFGVYRPALSDPNHSPGRASAAPVLDLHNRTAFEYLAEFNRRGEVWVPALSRFLEFMRVRNFMNFDVQKEGEATVILIHGMDCPVEGRCELSLEQINGIAFLIPPDLGPYRIQFQGRDVTGKFKRERDTVYTNRAVLHFPYERRSTYIPSSEWYGASQPARS